VVEGRDPAVGTSSPSLGELGDGGGFRTMNSGMLIFPRGGRKSLQSRSGVWDTVPLCNLHVCAKFHPFAMEMHKTTCCFGLPRNAWFGLCPCPRYFYTGFFLSTVLFCMSRGQFSRCTVSTLCHVHVLCRNSLTDWALKSMATLG